MGLWWVWEELTTGLITRQDEWGCRECVRETVDVVGVVGVVGY